MKTDWEDNDWWTQASLLQYEGLRQHEEFEILEVQIKAAAKSL